MLSTKRVSIIRNILNSQFNNLILVQFYTKILKTTGAPGYLLPTARMKVNMIALKVKIAYQFSDNAKNCIGDYCHCIGNLAGNTSALCSP